MPASQKRSKLISTLSKDQLERKRKMDREAQRVNRQRTKQRIETLEQQNSELKAKIVALYQHIADAAVFLQYGQNSGVHKYTNTAPAYGK
jgi:hypothetical protein